MVPVQQGIESEERNNKIEKKGVKGGRHEAGIIVEKLSSNWSETNFSKIILGL